MAAAAPVDDGLRKLEYLSLVSKVRSELETHIGVGDKVLAEFITELSHEAPSVVEFDAKLKANGADLPDYFVRTLLTIIHAILPSPQNPGSAASHSNAGGSKYRALTRPDDPDRARDLRLELERDASAAAAAAAPARDRRRDNDRSRERDQDRGLCMKLDGLCMNNNNPPV